MYHTVGHSKGDNTKGAGNSAIFSVDVAASAPSLATAVIEPPADWCAADLCGAGNPVVSIAAAPDATSLTVLAARKGIVESAPVTMEAIGRRLDVYVATAALDADGLVTSDPLTELRNVSGYKTGVPDQPNFAGYGYAFATADGARLRAALVPENDTLSVDLVDVALDGAAAATTSPWYRSAAPNTACFPLTLLADDE